MEHPGADPAAAGGGAWHRLNALVVLSVEHLQHAGNRDLGEVWPVVIAQGHAVAEGQDLVNIPRVEAVARCAGGLEKAAACGGGVVHRGL